MSIDKKHLVYAGIGLFFLLVVINSTKKVELKEADGADLKPFDHSSLPSSLKPPYKLAEGDELPRPIRKNLNLTSIGLKPRFDNHDF